MDVILNALQSVLSMAVLTMLGYFLALVIFIPSLMTKVFVIQSAMPVIAQSAIVAAAFGGDQYYATYMVTITSILSVVFIPAYMVLLNGV